MKVQGLGLGFRFHTHVIVCQRLTARLAASALQRLGLAIATECMAANGNHKLLPRQRFPALPTIALHGRLR